MHPFLPLNWFLFNIGAFATRSKDPNRGLKIKCPNSPKGVVNFKQYVESSWVKPSHGWNEISMGHLIAPTHTDRVNMLFLIILTYGGRFKSAKKKGCTVICEDLNGDIPSVLNVMPC